MELLKLAALCAICVLPVALLRRKTPEQALLLTAAVLAVVLARCLAAAAPLLEEVRLLFERAGVETAYIAVLLRTADAMTFLSCSSSADSLILKRNDFTITSGNSEAASVSKTSCSCSNLTRIWFLLLNSS